MNFEPVPLPEPPSLFDVDTVAAGGAGPIAPETTDLDFAWMPWGLLWPVHDLVVDESLPDAAVAEVAPPATSDDVAVPPFSEDLPLPAEIAEIAPAPNAAIAPVVRSTRVRSAATLVLVVVSMAALLAAVVGIVIAAVVLALQSALG